MDTYFEEIMIWQRLSDTASVRYCCLKDLRIERYVVQSKDYFMLPPDEILIKQLNEQFIELFTETDPYERSELWFNSPLEAIAAHDAYFSAEESH